MEPSEPTVNPVHAKVTPERNDLQLATQELGVGTELGAPAEAPPAAHPARPSRPARGPAAPAAQNMARGLETPGYYLDTQRGSVATMPLAVRLAFRRKMLCLLAFQLAVVLGLMVLVAYTPLRRVLVDDYIVCTLSFMAACFMLFVLHVVAERYPLNVACLAVFTVFLGLFLGAAEGAFRSKANFQIFTNLAALVLTLLPLATTTTNIEELRVRPPFSASDAGGAPAEPAPRVRVRRGEAQPLSYGCAAPLAWAIVLCGSSIANHYSHWGHSFPRFVACWIVITMIFAFFAWDAAKTEHTLGADAYLQAVVAFYVDIVKVFGFLCCCWCNMVLYCVGFYAISGEPQNER